MRKRGKLSRLYVKYIIKTPAVFYIFLITGVALFVTMTLSLKVDVRKRFSAYKNNNTITVSQSIENVSSIGLLYLYSNKNEQVIVVEYSGVNSLDGKTEFFINEDSITHIQDLPEAFFMEITTDSITLLNLIFAKAGRSV